MLKIPEEILSHKSDSIEHQWLIWYTEYGEYLGYEKVSDGEIGRVHLNYANVSNVINREKIKYVAIVHNHPLIPRFIPTNIYDYISPEEPSTADFNFNLMFIKYMAEKGVTVFDSFIFDHKGCIFSFREPKENIRNKCEYNQKYFSEFLKLGEIKQKPKVLTGKETLKIAINKLLSAQKKRKRKEILWKNYRLKKCLAFIMNGLKLKI